MDEPVVPGPASGSARLGDREIEERLGELDDLLGRIEAMAGGDGEVAREAVTVLAEVYGEALARAVGAAGRVTARQLAGDELVGHLMALHGVHPDSAEERAARAVDELRGHLDGGHAVELAGVSEGVARISVTASGCGADALSSSVRDIVLGEAPDLAEVSATRPEPAPAFIPLGSLRRQERP